MTDKFSVELNKVAESLFSGRFLNGETLGYIAGKVLEETIGKGSTSVAHFNLGQGRWPSLAESTLHDRRKRDKRIFVRDGKVLKAISASPNKGEVLSWGSSADIHTAPSFRKKRYVANGMWSTAEVGRTKLIVTTGFSGKLKHSTAFNRLRRKIAREKLGGGRLSAKAVRQAVSVGEVERTMHKHGRVRKYEAKGAKGIKGGKMVKATGKDNLAYANIVQTGKFVGVQSTKTGQVFTASHIGNLVRHGRKGALPGKGEYVRKFEGGKQRELLPYQDADADRIANVIRDAMSDIFRQMGGH